MKKVEYSQIVRYKLKMLKIKIIENFGLNVAKKTINKILKMIENLEEFDEMGFEISAIYDIETDYRILHSSGNYFIYRVQQDKVIIVEMFDEREDFMYKLFGIRTLIQENEAWWDE